MSSISIKPSYPIFTDIDGQPLEYGYVWIGATNLDPQTNPIAVYLDAALTIPAAQPIRTLDGYLSMNGSPANIYVAQEYSIRVMNKNGTTVYSSLNGLTDRLSSAQISYLPAGTGAVSTTVQAKLRQTVSVKDFGAVGNGVADDTAAIQAAITKVVSTGGKLYFPNGKYITSSPLVIDYSAVTTDPVNGTYNRLHIEGDGPGSTMIWPSHAGKCIDYRGGTIDGVSAFLEIRGIALRGPARAAGSIGLSIDNCAYWSLTDFDISLFEYGINGTDILSGSISKGEIRLNQYGGQFAYANFSRPNAISFRDVIIATNYTYGLLATGAACFLIDGGTVEGNGIGLSLANPAAWGIKSVDAGVEGGVGLVIRGTYFEGNNGNADVWISQTANTAHHSVHGSFMRYLSGQYVTYNVLFDKSGAGAASTVAVGGGYKSTGTYVESMLRPFFGGGIAYFSEMPGNYYGSTVALGREVFTPIVQPSVPIAFLPSAASFTGTSLYCSDLGGGGGLLVSDGAKWRRSQPGVETIVSDANFTLTTLNNAEQILHGGTLTANRTITLSTTNAYPGARFRVTRSGGGAFTLSVGGLKLLSTSQWADVCFDGGSWVLAGYGTL